jgi:hypothetical protein
MDPVRKLKQIDNSDYTEAFMINNYIYTLAIINIF